MRRQTNLAPRCAETQPWRELNRLYLALVRDRTPDKGTVGVELVEGSQPVQAVVASTNANSTSGMVWLPQVGDMVVVAFAQGHKAMPVVLGSLYAVNDTLHAQAADNLTIKHQSGSTVVIAQDGTITVTQKAGAFLAMRPNGDVEVKHATSNADILLDSTGAAFSLGQVKAKVSSASVLLDANSGGGGAKIEVLPGGAINITPGGSGVVNIGGSSTFVARDGDQTSSPIGAGVADHYHVIIGSSSKVVAG